MRIGLVCPYNYYRPGGVQICITELAKELSARGHYVRIIAPKPRRLPAEHHDNVILLGGSAELNTFATKADVGISVSNEKLDAMLAEQNFDVLHFHEPGVPLLSMQLMARSKAAHVATMHATLPEGVVTKSYQKLMQPAAKFIEPRTDVLTAVSTVAQATAHMFTSSADIRVIPNGIRLMDYLPTKKNTKTKKQKTIVYVGRLEKRKGVKYLLKAFARLRQEHHGIRLVIAGNGDLKPTLEAYVARHDIPDVDFLGFVPEKDKIRLLQASDIYCSPALYGESFGIVLLEAMAAGCVAVAGNNPGYASVMTGRGRLSLVNPESTEDFAQRLELMLFDTDIRALWIDWATKYVKQFDYADVVDQYEQAYKDARKIRAKRV
mgnify:CR=1 FL=1